MLHIHVCSSNMHCSSNCVRTFGSLVNINCPSSCNKDLIFPIPRRREVCSHATELDELQAYNMHMYICMHVSYIASSAHKVSVNRKEKELYMYARGCGESVQLHSTCYLHNLGAWEAHSFWWSRVGWLCNHSNSKEAPQQNGAPLPVELHSMESVLHYFLPLQYLQQLLPRAKTNNLV